MNSTIILIWSLGIDSLHVFNFTDSIYTSCLFQRNGIFINYIEQNAVPLEIIQLHLLNKFFISHTPCILISF